MRLGRRGGQTAPADGRPRYAVPPARELRRERKALLELRESRLRDLGGLALEMYKRDRFNAALVVERCAELVAIEARVHQIDALLDGSAGLLGGGRPLCVCGAPLLVGARFCASCGRQLAGAPP
ncbi:MAG TPA: hypothetical protein VNJ53_05060, partial [Gaiellaceae bacterium]|nr:hypothetical protein [Gaiellaceae bacterium]